MIRFKLVMMKPAWSDISVGTSISRMMNLLLDQDIWEIESHLWGGTAYLTVVNKDGSATFKRLKENDWNIIYHMITVNPIVCSCWACQWRLKRQRYSPTSYKHLFEQHADFRP